tara:strand:+ start:1589 stop:3226 length:1638 start_codon:yes stop_codon:yes gene_type:complete
MGTFDSDVERENRYDTPEDFKSGLADILSEMKKLYEARKGAGFVDYEGERIADFTPEEKAAMTGISSLVGEGKKYFDPATDLAKGLADKFTTDTAQEYMSPYQQAVTDVAKRKAREDFEQTMQNIGLKSALGGGRRGTARAIIEAEGTQDLGQRLSDLQVLGSQKAFEDARSAFEKQKGRERQAGSALAALGSQAPAQALKELTALSGVGEAKRDMDQTGLDLAYKNFMDKQDYPYQLLDRYQSTLYGYPYQSFDTVQGFSKPSGFQNLMSVVNAGKSLFPSFGFKGGGHIAFRSRGGLSGLTANYQEGTGSNTVGDMSSLKANLTSNLLGSLNLGTMSDSLLRLQELRTKIAEAKAKKVAEQDTFMGRLGTFAQGVAEGFDPTKPQTMAGSLAAGAKAVQDKVQDPELVKAQAEAEGIEGEIKTQQAMAEISKNYLNAIGELSNDIEGADFNNIEDAVYKSFGFTLSADGKLQGIGGKPITEQQQLEILKKQKTALEIFKTQGYQGVANFLAGGNKIKKRTPGPDTIVSNIKIMEQLEKAKGGQ